MHKYITVDGLEFVSTTIKGRWLINVIEITEDVYISVSNHDCLVLTKSRCYHYNLRNQTPHFFTSWRPSSVAGRFQELALLKDKSQPAQLCSKMDASIYTRYKLIIDLTEEGELRW